MKFEKSVREHFPTFKISLPPFFLMGIILRETKCRRTLQHTSINWMADAFRRIFVDEVAAIATQFVKGYLQYFATNVATKRHSIRNRVRTGTYLFSKDCLDYFACRGDHIRVGYLTAAAGFETHAAAEK